MKLGPEGKGWLYVVGLIVLGAAALLIQQCSDSSEYTLHGERFNRAVFIPIAGVLVAVVLVWYWLYNRKK